MDRIDIYAAARSGAGWSGRLALATLPRLCASLTDGPGDRDALLTFACRGSTDAHGRPALELRLEAALPLRCDRCGQMLALPLSVQRTFYFVSTLAELAAIPVDDTPEEALLGSAQFDLAGLIEDEAILHLPISPRHADCVAVTRNAPAPPGFEDATAASGKPPHPFASLAALRDQLQEPAATRVKPSAGKPGMPVNGASATTRPRKSRSRAS
jgi:uncharacterized protein